jgi:hypothetical protein
MRTFRSTIIVLLLSFPGIALAQGGALDRARGVAGAGGITTTTHLPELVGNIINSVIAMLGVVMVVLIVYAGFLYLTAAGDDDKVGHAKKILINSVIGLALVFTAYAITSFVIIELTKTRLSPAGSGIAPDPG